MPIKFRCQHCRQYLGISRSKAGGIVDCPTCGRSIRVPDLDGKARPMPKPKLNLRDSKLTEALDELAAIGATDASEVSDAQTESGHMDRPRAISAPEPIEPPPPITTTAPIEPVDLEDRSSLSESETAGPTAENLIDEQLAKEFAPFRSATARKSRKWWIVAAVAVATIIGVSAGYAVKSLTGEPLANARSSDESDEAERTVDSTTHDTNQPIALEGRITYQAESGRNRPDQGARVVVLPTEYAGGDKLPIEGFLESKPNERFQTAASRLRELGGNLAVVDEDGRYSISLPEAGAYQVLVLSHHLRRDDQSVVDRALLTRLAEFFEQPTKLLGRVQYHFDQIKYSGTEPEIWDYTFRP